MTIEATILSNLIHNEVYARKVIPFLKKDYFGANEGIVSDIISKFFSEYNKPITKEILHIELAKRRDLNETQYKDVKASVEGYVAEPINEEWLLNETEKFCQQRAVYNAIMQSIKVIEGKVKDVSQDAIPSLLSEALSVCFDNHVGHDYLEDWESRYDFYHRVEEKIAFDLDMFNKITGGGLSKKSLNVILAGTAVGKSLFMCHVAASHLIQGKNVLYITMEMAEERIAERIDANLLNLSMTELKVVDKEIYGKRIDKIKNKSAGRLIVKEFPTATAHSGHFRALIEELKLKKEFTPDAIFIDYLNICASARMKMGASVNSYTYIKSIAEELRGLAVEYNLPILTATQTTRSGYTNTDIGLEDTSESFGLPATADLMFALISSEELQELNQIMVKQLKNRYSDVNNFKRFVIGVDKSKMMLYNVEESAQNNISDKGTQEEDVPAFDKSKFGKRMKGNTDYGGLKF
ncbi:41 helicase [uncultured Caudovirales phage]|uniref:DnaB-like replicative helicase n=1 Tax=uncultured Caudovirales phage TaxID=2100421 RepID=A0A6J5KW13_9CAUD|nr:41 helicase [uncultured Caudovirales phage]